MVKKINNEIVSNGKTCFDIAADLNLVGIPEIDLVKRVAGALALIYNSRDNKSLRADQLSAALVVMLCGDEKTVEQFNELVRNRKT